MLTTKMCRMMQHSASAPWRQCEVMAAFDIYTGFRPLQYRPLVVSAPAVSAPAVSAPAVSAPAVSAPAARHRVAFGGFSCLLADNVTLQNWNLSTKNYTGMIFR